MSKTLHTDCMTYHDLMIDCPKNKPRKINSAWNRFPIGKPKTNFYPTYPKEK